MIEAILDQLREPELVMWLIAVCSMLGVAITLERITVIKRAAAISKENLLNHINSYILQGNLEKAISICSQTKTPLTNIIRMGLVQVANGKNEEEVQTAMDSVALNEIPKIEKRINYLSTLSNLATLLGLLGTVKGLIGAFAAVANVAPAEKAALLSNSISIAMSTTAFGLMVAIPLLAVYGWLNSWGQNVVDDIHEASVTTLNFVLTNREKISG